MKRSSVVGSALLCLAALLAHAQSPSVMGKATRLGRVDGGTLPPLGEASAGGLVYDSIGQQILYSDGGSWFPVGGGASGAVSGLPLVGSGTAGSPITLYNDAGFTSIGNWAFNRTLTPYGPTNDLGLGYRFGPTGVTGVTSGDDNTISISTNGGGLALTLNSNGQDYFGPGFTGVDLGSTSLGDLLMWRRIFAYGRVQVPVVDAGQVVSNLFASPDSRTVGISTLVAGTNTVTVEASTSRCFCQDQSLPAAVQCVVSGTTLTITGTGTDVISYFCVKDL